MPPAPVARSLADLGRMTLRERVHQPLYWEFIRFLVFGRAVPAVLFGFMGWLQVVRVVNSASTLGPAGWVTVLERVVPGAMYALFCIIPVGIYLCRPMPIARDGRPIVRATAFAGTTMQLVIGAFLPVGPVLFGSPPWLRLCCAIASIAAFALAVLSMGYLRRSLSIIPEARRAVTGGPYRLLRHPLYTAEIAAGAALALTHAALVPVLGLAGVILVQNVRARFEENLLAQQIAGYAEYAAVTPRLVPRFWSRAR